MDRRFKNFCGDITVEEFVGQDWRQVFFFEVQDVYENKNEEAWKTKMPSGTRYSATLDYHGIDERVTTEPLILRDVMRMAEKIPVPCNTIGGRYFHVFTPWGRLSRTDFSENGVRGSTYRFVPEVDANCE